MRCLIEKLKAESILILLIELFIFITLILIIILIITVCWFWLRIISWELIKWSEFFKLWSLLIILIYEIFIWRVSELRKVFVLIELLIIFSHCCESFIFWLSWHHLISWSLSKSIKSVELLLSEYLHELSNNSFREWFINELTENDVKMTSYM